jgi:hypothetical protein
MTWTPEQRRAWNERNPGREREIKLAYQREYFDLNADEIRRRAREGYQPGRHRDAGLKWRHGVRPEDYAAMWQAQDGRCYLCGDEMTDSQKVVIDHDHSCCGPHKSCRICRRGLAHDQCNVTIGYAGESPERLRRMADELEAAQLAFWQRHAAGGQLTLPEEEEKP